MRPHSHQYCVASLARTGFQMLLAVYFVVFAAGAGRCGAVFEENLPSVAVVGGGIGGASCAYHLRQLFGPALPITVFEDGEIGGRARVVSFAGKEYEVGGAVIHDKNREMSAFLETLGLTKEVDDGSRTFALYDGKEVYLESSRNNFITSLKLLWRYGWQLIKLRQLTASFLKEFERIYRWQQELQAFTTLPNLMLSMSDELLNATQHQLRQSLLDQGFGVEIIDELVAAAMKVNYGQTPDNLHAFVGAVSLAGMGGDLWSVLGGNHLIAKGLLELAGASTTAEKILSVEFVPSPDGADGRPRYRLTSTNDSRLYDVVVLALPFITNGDGNLKFDRFSQDIASKIARPYKRIFSTFVKGKPNYSSFGYRSMEEFPGSLLVTGSSFFNSMALQSPVNESSYTPDVYKVFSPEELTTAQLDILFASRELVTSTPWNAYPLYSPQASFPPIVLHSHLYYANAIETAASAMEMAAIGGHNVAQLIYNRWLQLDHLIDNMFVIEERHIKMEL